jgi:hypothetical protein
MSTTCWSRSVSVDHLCRAGIVDLADERDELADLHG